MSTQLPSEPSSSRPASPSPGRDDTSATAKDIVTPQDDLRDNLLQPKWQAKEKNKGSYIYTEWPDYAVFDWDTDTIKLAESRAFSYDDPNELFWGFRKYAPMERDVRRQYKEDLETKKLLLKARRVAEALEARGAKEEAVILRDTSRNEARRFVRMKRYYDRLFNQIISLLVGLFILISMCGATLVSFWVGTDRGWWLLLLGPVELFVFIFILFLLFDIVDFNSHTMNIWWRLKILPEITVVVASLIAAITVGLRYRNGDPGWLLELSAGIAVTGLLFMSGITVTLFAANRLEYRGQGLKPEVALQLDLVELVALAREWQASEGRNQEELLRSLEITAQRAQWGFSNLVRRSQDSRLHLWASDRGRRVAAVIRKHREKVLEISASERDSVTASLMNGIVFLNRKDWVSLLVVEPEPPVKSLARRFAPRIALATILIILAFLLPVLIPQVIKDPASFQATILVTAGFALLAPDVQKAADAVKSFGAGAGK
jgi:hypothetical protein